MQKLMLIIAITASLSSAVFASAEIVQNIQPEALMTPTIEILL